MMSHHYLLFESFSHLFLSIKIKFSSVFLHKNGNDQVFRNLFQYQRLIMKIFVSFITFEFIKMMTCQWIRHNLDLNNLTKTIYYSFLHLQTIQKIYMTKSCPIQNKQPRQLHTILFSQNHTSY